MYSSSSGDSNPEKEQRWVILALSQLELLRVEWHIV